MKSFRKKFILFFIPPALAAMVIGTYFNLNKIEELGMRNQLVDVGAKTLTFIKSISEIDREAQNISKKVLSKTFIGKSKNDEAILDVLEGELSKSNYAGSLSMFLIDTLELQHFIKQYEVKKKDSLIIRTIVNDGRLSIDLSQMLHEVFKSGSTYWTPKYSPLQGDTTSIYSFFAPVFIEGTVFALTSYNVNIHRTVSFFNASIVDNPFDFYAFSKNSDLIYSSFVHHMDDMNTLKKSDENQMIVDTIRQFILHSEESKPLDYKKIQITKLDDTGLFGTFVSYPPIWLFFSFSKSTMNQTVWNEVRYLILLNALILVLLILTIIIFSNKLSKPVLEMQKSVHLFLKTNKKVPLTIKRNDELGNLAKALDFMQDELIRKEQEVKKLDEAKYNFLKMISHEVRTPLNGILGSAYFLKESIENEDLSEFVEMLAESADRLDFLSRKALTITELQVRESLVMDENINLYDFLNEVINQNSKIIDQNRVRLITPQKGLFLNINTSIITEAITEIIHNTVRYADKNSVLTIKLSALSSGCRIDFENVGPIIPLEKINSLARPFELGQEHYDKYTGLGLALVSMIMKLHNGYLTIENTDTGVKTSLHFH